MERQALKNERPDDFRTGDLMIGEFLGDSDLVMLRCDRSAADFGAAVVVLPIDRRNSWPRVGSSLLEFIEHFVQEGGQKFWPYPP